MPIGIMVCSGFLVAAFFLRSSSIPTGLSSQQQFLACCGSLLAAFGCIWVTRTPRVSVVGLMFVLLTLPSLRAAEDPQSAGLRWCGWLLIMAVVGPLFLNEIRLKVQVLDWTRKLLLICALGSLVLNCLGIKLEGRGVFFGLMNHSMILAPVCALAAIDLFCSRNHKKGRLRIVTLVVCCLTCIGAGSRGSVVGLAAGILVHVAHRREVVYVCVLAVAGFVAAGFVQLSRNDAYQEKLGGDVYGELVEKGTNNTREQLWGFRISEFKSSPVLGVGFQEQRLYREDSNKTLIEPGSSYLAVLSMTGTVGAIGFILIAGKIFTSLYSNTCAIPPKYKDVLRGWMAFFVVHMVVEGYIFACGSLLCFLFWLTAGCTISLHHLGRRKQLRHRIALRVAA